MNLHTIAKLILLAEKVSLSAIQAEALEKRISALDDAARAALQENPESSRATDAIENLRSNEKLWAILSLSDFTLGEMTDILAELLEDDIISVTSDHKLRKPEPLDDNTKFLNAKFPCGKPCQTEDGLWVDEKGSELDEFYIENIGAEDDAWLSVRIANAFSRVRALTNRQMLEFVVYGRFKTDNDVIIKRVIGFGKKAREEAERYFDYWLGANFRSLI